MNGKKLLTLEVNLEKRLRDLETATHSSVPIAWMPLRHDEFNNFLRQSNWPLAIVLFSNGLMLLAFIQGSLHSSPAFDESAHFTSGLFLAVNYDAGYFKVNPPVNKWLTACSSFLSPDLIARPVAPSSNFPNAARPEFIAGDSVLELNRDGSFFPALVIARLTRIPFFFIASWMLWQLTIQWPTANRLLCQVFWCTSPLLLGHGWIVSADALCGVAMCFILWTTNRLWKNPTWIAFSLSGLAWGLAIGTKFTFGPLYLAYPLAVHLCASNGWTTAMVMRAHAQQTEVQVSVFRRVLFASRYWIVHAAVACLVVNALYLFHETAMPIGKHDFIGITFRSLTIPNESDLAIVKTCKSLVAMIPSPFPRSFLEGVDQQMADMDRPRGAYLLGSRIPGEIYWFHLVGYAMKEQLAVLLAAMIGLFCFLGRRLPRKLRRVAMCKTVEDNRSANSKTIEENCTAVSKTVGDNCSTMFKTVEDNCSTMFCAFFLLVFFLFMTTQSNLVWNVRYLIPALPVVYLLVASKVPTFEIQFASKTRTVDLLFVALISIASIEFLFHFPHHFSYINPLFGGSYRVPIALNDSNFDYGQDLFYARYWVERHQAKSNYSNASKVYGALSGHGCYWLEGLVEPATVEVLQRVIDARKEVQYKRRVINAISEPTRDMLVVSRGLFHPEPWAVGYTKLGDDRLDPDELLLVQELLSHPPDVWITPVVVVYWVVREGQ